MLSYRLATQRDSDSRVPGSEPHPVPARFLARGVRIALLALTCLASVGCGGNSDEEGDLPLVGTWAWDTEKTLRVLQPADESAPSERLSAARAALQSMNIEFEFHEDGSMITRTTQRGKTEVKQGAYSISLQDINELIVVFEEVLANDEKAFREVRIHFFDTEHLRLTPLGAANPDDPLTAMYFRRLPTEPTPGDAAESQPSDEKQIANE